MVEERRSPLHERQVALGARFAPFGGWTMPVEYAGAGVLAEHAAVRSAVGVFDVSHLGKAVVSGPGSRTFLDTQLSNDLGKIGPGQAQYTLLCTEGGGVLDDLIVYLRSEDELFLVPNAANCAAVVDALSAAAPAGVSVRNVHEDFAVIAVQGTYSDEVLVAAGLPAGHPYMSFIDAEWEGARLSVCRTGYTGERGYELVVAGETAPTLWDALLAAGGAYGVQPCGLGARDTLRTEMGYPLHGQDLSVDISPVQARLGWAVGWRKQTFVGAAALRAERSAGPRRLLHGLRALGRAIPRPGMRVIGAAGTEVGVVTSGTFSPTLKTGIGLALLSAEIADGESVTVLVRNREELFEVVRPPFVTPAVREH